MKKSHTFLFAGWLILTLSSLLTSKGIQADTTTRAQITSFLKAGPIAIPMPVFHDVKNFNGNTFDLKDLATFDAISVYDGWPAAGDTITWDDSTFFIWQPVSVDSEGVVILPHARHWPEIVYLASYIEVTRWTKIGIEVTSPNLLQIFLDGKSIGSKMTADSSTVNPGKTHSDFKLVTGKHLLVIKCVRDAKTQTEWRIKAELRAIGDQKLDDLNLSTNPDHFMNLKHQLDSPRLTDVSISPDGELAAVLIRQAQPPGDDTEEWLELRNTRDGRLVQTYRGGMQISGFCWAPIGQKFTYLTRVKDHQALWLVDLERGTNSPLLPVVDNLSGYTWSPNGAFIIYSLVDKASSDSTGLKRVLETEDRWPGWRDRSFLFLARVPGGARIRLTAGRLSTDLNSISQDGQKLLFTRSKIDYRERPYTKTELFVLSLATMTLDSLWAGSWFRSAQWSPDGQKILLTGGPSMFGTIGQNVPTGQIPNDYDIQAYLLDPATGQVEAITRDFAPSIDTAIWPKPGHAIYFQTTDRSCSYLYRYDLKRGDFKRIDTGFEALDKVDFAPSKPIAICSGTSVSDPPSVHRVDLQKNSYRELTNPGKKDFVHIKFGTVAPWSFRNASDTEIDGYVYYPPDFDPRKKYPCIVYYYGGTTPVTREFEGRYPKNLWAAHGYIVYVLQPGGAIGYGQAFSALHVNDWGKIVADEIILGTKKFLTDHPFVDAQRVACIGASYGGFMTLLLLTRTDMFKCAIAHAGISALPGYWGEGFWGYLYSAVASANSFPWNRKDIYIDQSPLFSADKIKTPLLLLHGSADTNVPPGESTQMYLALKLLGQEVEYIQVEDQDHLIMRYSRRKIWTQTIMAWFDRWLKEQPQWWQDLYPTK